MASKVSVRYRRSKRNIINKKPRIRLFREDKLWVAILEQDISLNQATQGSTKEEAAKNLRTICNLHLANVLDDIFRPYNADTMAPIRNSGYPFTLMKLNGLGCDGGPAFDCSCFSFLSIPHNNELEFSVCGIIDHLRNDHRLSQRSAKVIVARATKKDRAGFRNKVGLYPEYQQ